ncbi:MAG: glycosyltransferase [Ruminococcaceae bacterium]|nr:glycosyltransferase [Oscillospiraceae bacterium]
MDNIRLSIIVMTYKKFDNLQKNINSILSQNYSNYEVIVSDDGSPNIDTDFIYSLFPGNCESERFHLITRAENLGTVKNYNNAVLNAKGDIIIPLSQDDCFYDENVLSVIDKKFDDPKTNICLGIRKTVDKDEYLPNSYQCNLISEGNYKKIWFRNACKNMCYGAALYWRRDFLLDMGLFDEEYRLLEDYPMIMRCIENNERIKIISTPTVIWDFKGLSGIPKKTGLLAEDQFKFDQVIYKKAMTLLNSKTCRKYMYFKTTYLDKTGFKYKIYRYLSVDWIILYTKIMTKINKQPLMDYRFELLWKLECKATNKNKGT